MLLVILLIAIVFSFIITYFVTPIFINFFKEIGVESNDVHKKKQLIPMGEEYAFFQDYWREYSYTSRLKTFIAKDSEGSWNYSARWLQYC